MKSSILAQPQTIKTIMPSSNWSITFYIADLVKKKTGFIIFQKTKMLIN